MTRCSQPRYAFFDLDGTLTDSRLGITRCIEHALSSLEHELPADEALDSWIGPPLLQSFRAYLGSDSRATRALELYRERFARAGITENEVYDGVDSMLAVLAASDVQLCIVTSKPQVFAKRIASHFGLDRHLRAVYGSELDGTRGDKGELIAHSLQSESIDAKQAIMIGDRKHDVIGARHNGVPCIGVTWGFGGRQELTDAGADVICEQVPDLAPLIGSHWETVSLKAAPSMRVSQ